MWVEGGISRCFLQVVGSLVCSGVLLVTSGTVAVLGKWPPSPPHRLPFPRSLALTLAICLLLAVCSATHLVLSILHHSLYGYCILQDCLGILAWLVAYRQRVRLPSMWSHGMWLVVYWLLASVWQALQLPIPPPPHTAAYVTYLSVTILIVSLTIPYLVLFVIKASSLSSSPVHT